MKGKLKNHTKVCRAKRDMTQADLAKVNGSSRQAVNAIERSKYIPSTLMALKISEVFETTVEEIFDFVI